MALEDSLTTIGKNLSGAKSLRPGHIAIRLEGADGGHYHFECSPSSAKLVKGAPPGHPLIELIGDPKRVASALAGKDLRKQFLAGNFRIRGDLSYASELGLELGFIKRPL